MKSIEELLRNLARPDVLEFGLVTNRLPSINVGGRFEPVDDEAPSTDRVKQMLVAMGGGRFMETLSDKPVQWTTRLDGVGVIAVAAIMRKDVVQARFTVARREGAAGAGPRPGGPAPVPAAPPAASPAVRPAATAQHAQQPRAQGFSTTQQGPAVAPQQQPSSGKHAVAQPAHQAIPQPVQPPQHAAPQPSPLNPILTKTMSSPPPPMTPPMAQAAGPAPVVKPAASSGRQPVAPVHVAPAPAPAPVAPPPAPAPPAARDSSKEEWDDDDDDNEPTVQTLSPQTPKNVPSPTAADEPRPKPARRPEEVRTSSSTDVTAMPMMTAAPPSPTQTQAVPPVGQLPAPREPSGSPPPLTEASTSSGQLEDVDVEITTNDGSALAAAEGHEADADGIEQTVEVAPKGAKGDEAPESRPQPLAAKPEAKSDPALSSKTDPSLSTRVAPVSEPRIEKAKPVTGAMPSVAAMSAIPSTTPSGITAAPDKDRPRIDAAAALDSFLAMAVAAHATDLHLIAGRPVLLRVASDLVARTQAIGAEHVERIVKEVMPPRLREALDGEGACDFTIDHKEHGRFRVNLTRQRGGTSVALRVLGREFPSLRALALPEAVAGAAQLTQGLVLITGPAGHGKTTTLAALVDAINANADAPRHVYTIEDPIEHVHPKRRGMVTQREIGTHVKSWAQAIDDAVTSDVDVIVLGDLRDEAAMRAAVAGCEAGRLVLATMSCTSAARAVDRIIERFPTSEQPRTRASIASAMRLIIGQRLVPSADRMRLHLALETIPGTPALYPLIRDGRTHQIPALQQRASRTLGFIRLDDSLTELVNAQKVTLDVAKQFAESPADLGVKKG